MHSLYYCVNNNMVYGFNSTNNQFTYINKKSINILLYCTILPISFLISKILKIQFQDKMLMVIAMIFGAHLLPYSWLYNSKTYMHQYVHSNTVHNNQDMETT